jgi:pSer/pThr/pTyr-binding forkhead associated (FHA) protein
MSGLVVDLLFKGKVLRTIPFDRPMLRIGRMRENDVVVDNLSVSRFHARLVLEGGRVYLEDTGSENGSFVNETRVHGRAELAPGDRIVIGKHQLRVRSGLAEEEAPASAAPARRSDQWDAMQTYLAGPETQTRMRHDAAPQTAPAARAASEASAGSPQPAPSEAPSAPSRYAGLIVQRDGRIDRAVPWDSDALVVGRANDCDLVLGQDEVSRRHARFVRVGDRYEVEDLGSVNGTLVNGRRVERAALSVGDVIQIETYELTFVVDREPITGAIAPAQPAKPAPGQEQDHFAVTILQEELPLATEDDVEAGSYAPVTVAGEAAAPAAPLHVDLLASDGLDEPFGHGDLGASIDERKELASAQPRGSSRANSVQDLGPAPAPAQGLTLELHVAVELLPDPLRRAVEELGGSDLVLPAELHIKSR